MTRARDMANLGSQAGSGLDASDITGGALPVGVTGGSGLNALSASNLSAGTVPDARFPATLPAASGANLTALPAANVTGVLPVGVTGGSGLTHLASNPTVTLGSNATFPAGHMRFLAHSALTTIATGSVTSQTEMELVSLSTGTFTAGSKILLFGSGNVSQGSTSASHYSHIVFNGVSASTGTASDTGLTFSFNNAIAQEVGYQVASGHYSSDYAGTQLVTPTNGATECTYRLAYKTAQAQTDDTYFYRTRIALYEIYQ